MTGLPTSSELASLAAGAPLPWALHATDTDPNGGALTYSVTSSNTALLNPYIPTGQSIDISTNVGDMTFELFTTLAPDATQSFINEIKNGDFTSTSSNQNTFYRIVQGFMIQGGGTTTGVSSFDDQYNPDLRFTSAGILAMAKSADDTNSSQFFITDASFRSGDFQYSIIGFLTSGESVREQITADGTTIQTDPSGVGTPTKTVVINSVSLTTDTQNSVVLFASPQNAAGSGTVTVTVKDADGNTAQQTIGFTVGADAYASSAQPYLAPEGQILMPAGSTTATGAISLTAGQTTPSTYQIEATNVSGGSLYYTGKMDPSVPSGEVANDASVSGDTTDFNLSVDASTGKLSITPLASATVGVHELYLTVAPNATDATASDTTQSSSDDEAVPVYVDPAAPTSITLDTSTTPGTDGSRPYEIAGILANATVTLYADGTQIGTATASSSGGTVTIDAAVTPGDHVFTATQSLNNQTVAVGNLNTTTNLVSPQQAVTIDVPDSTPPQFTTTPFLDTAPGLTYRYIPSTNKSSTNTITYSLTGQPAGMTISNGVLTWPVPSTTSLGIQSAVTITATDNFGNVGTQTFRLTVVDLSTLTGPTGIELALANSGGTPEVSPSGTLIGTLSGDFSGVSDQLTYALVDGTGSTGNAAFTITGDQVFTNVNPPLNQAPYSIRVRATDSNGLSGEQTFAISVVNDAPSDIQLSFATAGGPLQYSRAGTLVGTLSSTDPAPADTNSYSLVGGSGGGDNAAFTIVGNQLIAAQPLTASSYSILVRTTDSVGLTFDKAFVIPVTPQTLPPATPVPFVTSVVSGSSLSAIPSQLQSIFPTSTAPLPSASLPALTSNVSTVEPTAVSQLFANNDLAGTKIGTSASGGGPVVPDQPGEPQLDSGSGSTDTPGSPQPSGRDGTGNPQQRPNTQKTSARASSESNAVNIDADAIDAAMERYASEEDFAEEVLDC